MTLFVGIAQPVPVIVQVTGVPAIAFPDASATVADSGARVPEGPAFAAAIARYEVVSEVTPRVVLPAVRRTVLGAVFP